jgi:hypothetical protein
MAVSGTGQCARHSHARPCSIQRAHYLPFYGTWETEAWQANLQVAELPATPQEVAQMPPKAAVRGRRGAVGLLSRDGPGGRGRNLPRTHSVPTSLLFCFLAGKPT